MHTVVIYFHHPSSVPKFVAPSVAHMYIQSIKYQFLKRRGIVTTSISVHFFISLKLDKYLDDYVR